MTTWDATDRPIGGRATPIADPMQEEKITRTYPKWEGRILALAVLAVSLFVGYVLVFRYKIIYVDAWTRALEPLYTVFQPGFHLAAIGFVWNPLPSLLMLPFAIFRDVWPPLMQLGFASNILSSLFAGVAVYHLDRILWRFGFGRTARILWCLLYIAAPLILLYSGNGMTDGMACATFIASLDGVIEYFQDGRMSGMIRAGVWIAAAFMIRYEAIPVGGLLGIGIALTIWRSEGNRKKGIAFFILFIFLEVSAVVVWMLLNWMIMKNPLYFLTSHSGNASQVSAGRYNTPFMLAARHHLSIATLEVLGFTVLFVPFLPAAVAVALLQLRRKPDPLGLPLLFASFGAPVLQIVLLYLHKSADWERFFIYYIPFGFILCAYLVYVTRKKWEGLALGAWLPLVACVVLASADFVGFKAIQSPVWGHGDNAFVSRILQGTVRSGGESSSTYMKTGVQIADYINTHPHLTVLLSTFNSFGAIPFIKNPAQVVITNEADFRSVMLNPRGRVNSIIIGDPKAPDAMADVLVRTYPTMYFGGVPWVKFVHQFPGGYRLFHVLPSAP